MTDTSVGSGKHEWFHQKTCVGPHFGWRYGWLFWTTVVAQIYWCMHRVFHVWVLCAYNWKLQSPSLEVYEQGNKRVWLENWVVWWPIRFIGKNVWIHERPKSWRWLMPFCDELQIAIPLKVSTIVLGHVNSKFWSWTHRLN